MIDHLSTCATDYVATKIFKNVLQFFIVQYSRLFCIYSVVCC